MEQLVLTPKIANQDLDLALLTSLVLAHGQNARWLANL
jgi:hypothetical protein